MRFLRHIKHHFIPSKDNAYRPHILHRPWLIFFFVVILATEGFLVSNLIARQSSQNFLAAIVPAEIIALTNTERADNNAHAVAEDSLLEQAAQAKANDMAAKGYFAHIGPDGKTPWQWIAGSGYQYQYAGENLAVRFIDSTDVVNAWMESPTHRANIVKPVYTEIGVGVAQGMYEGQSATYVVQYFGTPLALAASAPKPIATHNVPSIAAASATPIAATTHTNEPSITSAAPTLATNQNPLPQVEGASTAAVPATLAANNFTSYTQSFLKQVLRAFAEPKTTANWILGLCAAILVLAICFTFFMHIHIQPTHMLMSASFVALFALTLIGLNSRLGVGGAGVSPNASLAASPVEAFGNAGVVIGDDGASVGYALFPAR